MKDEGWRVEGWGKNKVVQLLSILKISTVGLQLHHTEGGGFIKLVSNKASHEESF